MFSVQIPAKMLLPGSSHGWYHRNSVMRKREVTSKLHMSRRLRVRSDFFGDIVRLKKTTWGRKSAADVG